MWTESTTDQNKSQFLGIKRLMRRSSYAAAGFKTAMSAGRNLMLNGAELKGRSHDYGLGAVG